MNAKTILLIFLVILAFDVDMTFLVFGSRTASIIALIVLLLMTAAAIVFALVKG